MRGISSGAERNSRLDERLVTRGLFPSRSRARDAILRGTVMVDGLPATKAGQAIGDYVEIAVFDPAARYVSRAALKLVAGLDHFGFDPRDGEALDIGASTGGFTQVLLERGAAHVTAIDVGRDQLAVAVKCDPRVASIEELNARDLNATHLRAPPDLVVCDVSFISLKLALPPALALAAPGARGVFLVKPQFEAGRDAIGKGGRVRDPARLDAVAADLSNWLDAQPGWQSLGTTPSPIDGGEGAREFLLGGVKDR